MSTHQNPAFLFPGQGAQYLGIGSDLHAELEIVRDTYSEASDALGYDIAALSFTGPVDDINRTRHTQPVLLTHSIACLRAFNQHTGDGVRARFAAGHSLGEYCALVAAGALSFSAALQLVKRRGELMGEFGRGEMQALMLDFESASQLASCHHCEIAACNLPEQNVVGGLAEDLDALLADMTVRFPKKRSARLKTEGAFHTYHMVEAARRFRDELAQVEFAAPNFSVASNFNGNFHDDDIAAVKSRLFLQLFNPVLWHQNLTAIGDAGADVLIEFGGGLGKDDAPSSKRPNLEGIIKKTYRGLESPPAYFAVINCETLATSAQAF